jgi:hypothetical protein
VSAQPRDQAAEGTWRAFRQRRPEVATVDLILPDLAGSGAASA